LCLTHQRTIPKGEIYYPKGETVIKMPKDTWGFVVGLVDNENKQQHNVIQKGTINGSMPSAKLRFAIVADKVNDVRLSRRQRFAKLQLVRCNKVNNMHACVKLMSASIGDPACAGVQTDSGSDSEIPSMPIVDAKTD
jgi:hypothetical protein